jgi:hypothetical protein
MVRQYVVSCAGHELPPRREQDHVYACRAQIGRGIDRTGGIDDDTSALLQARIREIGERSWSQV